MTSSFVQGRSSRAPGPKKKSRRLRPEAPGPLHVKESPPASPRPSPRLRRSAPAAGGKTPCRSRHPSPRRHSRTRSQAGFLVYGSSYRPSLLRAAGGMPVLHEWRDLAFVPDYSGGSTVDSHHLPSSSASTADTRDRGRFTCQCRASAAGAAAWTRRIEPNAPRLPVNRRAVETSPWVRPRILPSGSGVPAKRRVGCGNCRNKA